MGLDIFRCSYCSNYFPLKIKEKYDYYLLEVECVKYQCQGENEIYALPFWSFLVDSSRNFSLSIVDNGACLLNTYYYTNITRNIDTFSSFNENISLQSFSGI